MRTYIGKFKIGFNYYPAKYLIFGLKIMDSGRYWELHMGKHSFMVWYRG